MVGIRACFSRFMDKFRTAIRSIKNFTGSGEEVAIKACVSYAGQLINLKLASRFILSSICSLADFSLFAKLENFGRSCMVYKYLFNVSMYYLKTM